MVPLVTVTERAPESKADAEAALLAQVLAMREEIRRLTAIEVLRRASPGPGLAVPGRILGALRYGLLRAPVPTDAPPPS